MNIDLYSIKHDLSLFIASGMSHLDLEAKKQLLGHLTDLKTQLSAKSEFIDNITVKAGLSVTIMTGAGFAMGALMPQLALPVLIAGAIGAVAVSGHYVRETLESSHESSVATPRAAINVFMNDLKRQGVVLHPWSEPSDLRLEQGAHHNDLSLEDVSLMEDKLKRGIFKHVTQLTRIMNETTPEGWAHLDTLIDTAVAYRVQQSRIAELLHEQDKIADPQTIKGWLSTLSASYTHRMKVLQESLNSAFIEEKSLIVTLTDQIEQYAYDNGVPLMLNPHIEFTPTAQTRGLNHSIDRDIVDSVADTLEAYRARYATVRSLDNTP